MQTDTTSSILGKPAFLRSPSCGFVANPGGASRSHSCSSSAFKQTDVVFSVGIRSKCDDTADASALSSSGCSNADPCLSNNCDGSKAICRRKGASFTCECAAGYSGQGTTGTCVDIDECATGCHTCSASQTCVNYNLHSSPWKRFDCVDKRVSYGSFISETTQTLTLKTWAYAASPNICLTHRQLVWHAGLGSFFFLGGWGGPCASPGSYTCRSYVFKVVPGFAVSALADAPWAARDRFGAVYFQNKIWVLGGSCGSSFHGYQTLYNDVWSSADGVTWEQMMVNAPWSPRCFHSSSVLVWKNQIWIFGGDKSYTSSVMDVWASPDGIDWSSYGVFSAGARGSVAAGVLGVNSNRVCLVTGGGLYSSSSTSVTLMTEDGMLWQQVPSMCLCFLPGLPTCITFPPLPSRCPNKLPALELSTPPCLLAETLRCSRGAGSCSHGAENPGTLPTAMCVRSGQPATARDGLAWTSPMCRLGQTRQLQECL